MESIDDGLGVSSCRLGLLLALLEHVDVYELHAIIHTVITAWEAQPGYGVLTYCNCEQITLCQLPCASIMTPGLDGGAGPTFLLVGSRQAASGGWRS